MSESNIISGNTAECVKHFLATRQWGPAQEFLAGFIGVNKGTITRWKKGSLPTGEQLLKLRVLLYVDGYQVSEFVKLSVLVRQLGRMIALDLVSLEGARRELKYAKADGVYELVLRAGKPMPDKAWRLDKLVGGSEDELEELTSDLRSKLQQLPLESEVIAPRVIGRVALTAATSSSITNRPSVETGASSSDTTVHVLVLQLQAVGALAQIVDSAPNAERLRIGVHAAVGQESLKALIDILQRIVEE